ncbi:MAG TPA: fasciclin domain-containing protein [Candidatus Saccharimonadales bacterium]|nr:fasciclin domain-containing protein [Candidatus Saccharimonadales bacterium]
MADSKMTAAIVTLAVGALVGGGVGYAAGNNNSGNGQDNKTNASQATTASTTSGQSDGVTVGGAKMVATKDIVDNAANAKNVSTVVGLIQKAGLVDTLKGTGPFTVFGPNNDAFNAVPKNILDKVSGNQDLLKTVLTYHVVPGTYTTADLRAMAAKGESVTSVQGGMLSFKVMDNKVYVVDVTGQEVEIETADVISSNGVTHVVKNVLLPVDPSTL